MNVTHILFEKHLKELGLKWEAEYRFHAVRKWRFDYVIRLSNGEPLAIEIDGGIWTRGRHTRGAGYQKDLDKMNHATVLGYRYLKFSTEDVTRGRAKAFMEHWVCRPKETQWPLTHSQ